MRSSTTHVVQHRLVVERVRTQWNQGAVIARGRTRHLEVDGATYASFHPQRRFFGYAWDALAAVPLCHPLAAHDGGKSMRVLLIGLGGGTSLHAMRLMLPGVELVTAEIDPELVHVSRRHFGLAQTRAQVVVGDGYAHVDAHPHHYDVILDDAFLARGETARTEDVSLALVARMTLGLRPGGILASNVFTDVPNRPGRDRARRIFRQSFRHSFEIVPPRGANAILCGSAGLRPWAQVAEQVRALPNAARRAMERLNGLVR